MANEPYGWTNWQVWFAWRPVRLDNGWFAWLSRIERRVFRHEPIWGGAPDDEHDYRRL